MMNWKGVMPAITTCFNEDLHVDHAFVGAHCRWLLDNGCTGIVALGSLGEGATLSFDEKLDVSCMLYNNPIAYGTDFLPEQIRELAEEYANFEAVKESSTDARRVSAIRALVDRRLEISVGVDDAVLEAIGVGATGWIAGLANALPRESVDLFNGGTNGDSDKAFELYRWFLPLLRMDTVPNFVQLIKLVQAELGMGNTRVRPPRLELVGDELAQTKKIIHNALRFRPQPVTSYALHERK
jgi:dihydrodipicolinate synthase/N-acetylneuraminate lyase